jgi:hypothetical protein
LPWLHARQTDADDNPYDPAVQLTHTPARMREPAGHGRQAAPLEMKPGWHAKGQLVALDPTPV